MHHRVYRFRRSQKFSLQRTTVDLRRHRFRQIAFRHRANHARHLARRMSKIPDQAVHRANRVGP